MWLKADEEREQMASAPQRASRSLAPSIDRLMMSFNSFLQDVLHVFTDKQHHFTLIDIFLKGSSSTFTIVSNLEININKILKDYG